MRQLAILLLSIMASSVSAQRCEPPAVVMVLDRSSSMLERVPGASSKWQAGLMAVREAARALEGKAEVGLQVFPFPEACAPGEIVLEVGMHDASDVLAAAGRPPPSVGAYTPMAETLDVLATYAPLLAPERRGHVILVTDGWQWCAPYDRTTRFSPAVSVAALRDLGITVHVVGFGVGVDALTLNRAAVAGGAPRRDCDPEIADPMARGHCYHDARDAEALMVILEGLAHDIGEETCDGVDNDCDGRVDEGFDLDGDGYSTCGATDVQDCNDGDPRVFPGAEDRCDGVDQNCDGELDVGCACEAGGQRACGVGPGVCGVGRQRCVGGRWGVCEGGVAPRREVCDGVDDDCDGRTDEDAECAVGALCLARRCAPLAPDDYQIPPAEEPEPEPEPRVVPSAPGCGCGVPGAGGSGAALAVLVGALMSRRFRPIP